MIELEEMPKPIGQFIIDNGNGKQMPDGTYYHYTEVIKLLKMFSKNKEFLVTTLSNEEKIKLLTELACAITTTDPKISGLLNQISDLK